MKSVDTFVEKEFKGNYVIGLQIRSAYLRGNYIKAFIDCSLLIENYLPKDKPIRWFMSSDSNEVLVDLYKAVGNLTSQANKTFFTQGKTAHILKDPNAYRRTLFDLEVLARVDDLVITGGSTYGFVGMMKLGSLGYAVDFYEGGKCKRIRFSDAGSTPNGDYFF